MHRNVEVIIVGHWFQVIFLVPPQEIFSRFMHFTLYQSCGTLFALLPRPVRARYSAHSRGCIAL